MSCGAPRLDTSPIMLQTGIMLGPAQLTLEDKTQVESLLRERPTTAWRKDMTEKPYDFPNQYCTLPIRWMQWNPRNTYADDQNNRFVQRYIKPCN